MDRGNRLINQHLIWRAGFGPMAEELELLGTCSRPAYFEALLKASSRPVKAIEVAENFLNGFTMGVDDIRKMQQKELNPEDKKKLRGQSREDFKNLNLAWFGEMVGSEAQLLEKTSLFWHGHFASRNVNIFYQQLLLDTIRRNALGNFGDLLRQVSKSAAMINFLNNNQNRRAHPNENFAREVMELFTMGRGLYTEQDVKEAARSFTGWGSELNGEFVFRRGQHDGGTKTFMGKSGNFDGDDILDILLEQKGTAQFIARKAYRFFVNEQMEPDGRIDWLAGRFYQSNYSLRGLLKDIFTSDWFVEPQNIGSIVKSPVVLLAGIRRLLPMTLDNEEVQLLAQRALGQLLFNPPNVAGWPGGFNWIDSSSLMFRLQIPELIYAGSEFQLNPKEDDDRQMGMQQRMEMQDQSGMRRQNRQAIKGKIDWEHYLAAFRAIGREELFPAITGVVLQGRRAPSAELVRKYSDAGSRENFIKTATIRLMSTPEYQLC